MSARVCSYVRSRMFATDLAFLARTAPGGLLENQRRRRRHQPAAFLRKLVTIPTDSVSSNWLRIHERSVEGCRRSVVVEIAAQSHCCWASCRRPRVIASPIFALLSASVSRNHFAWSISRPRIGPSTSTGQTVRPFRLLRLNLRCLSEARATL
jgi:hypothetical protein